MFELDFCKLIKRLTLYEKVRMLNTTYENIEFNDLMQRFSVANKVTFFRFAFFLQRKAPGFLKKNLKRILQFRQNSVRVKRALHSSTQTIYPIGFPHANPVEGRFANTLEIYEQIVPTHLSR